MSRLLVAAFALAACADQPAPATPHCDTATMYLGDPVLCEDGVCIADAAGVPQCRRLCSNDGGPVCDEGWWYTLATREDHVCYCAPAP